MTLPQNLKLINMHTLQIFTAQLLWENNTAIHDKDTTKNNLIMEFRSLHFYGGNVPCFNKETYDFDIEIDILIKITGFPVILVGENICLVEINTDIFPVQHSDNKNPTIFNIVYKKF